MSDNYGSNSLSETELDALRRRVEAANRRLFGQPPLLVETPATPEEIAERAYCDGIAARRLEHELDPTKFWQLPGGAGPKW